jgi:hypothetical protein
MSAFVIRDGKYARQQMQVISIQVSQEHFQFQLIELL